jgi:electron transfer flavoprotein beta subunit
VEAVHAQQEAGNRFDILLFGNEAADTGDYQVGIRVAHALDLPCVTGIKGLEVRDGTAVARRESSGGWDVFEVSLPALFTIKEGINLPRYPSLPGRLKAKKKPVDQLEPARDGGDGSSDGLGSLEKVRLKLPPEQGGEVRVLGEGAAAVPQVVEILKALRMV